MNRTQLNTKISMSKLMFMVFVFDSDRLGVGLRNYWISGGVDAAFLDVGHISTLRMDETLMCASSYGY